MHYLLRLHALFNRSNSILSCWSQGLPLIYKTSCAAINTLWSIAIYAEVSQLT